MIIPTPPDARSHLAAADRRPRARDPLNSERPSVVVFFGKRSSSAVTADAGKPRRDADLGCGRSALGRTENRRPRMIVFRRKLPQSQDARKQVASTRPMPILFRRADRGFGSKNARLLRAKRPGSPFAPSAPSLRLGERAFHRSDQARCEACGKEARKAGNSPTVFVLKTRSPNRIRIDAAARLLQPAI